MGISDLAVNGWLAVGAQLVRGQNVLLYLRNGDRVSGTIVAGDTNRVVISTSWIKELAVLLSAIQRRESVTKGVATAATANPKAATPAAKPVARVSKPVAAALNPKRRKGKLERLKKYFNRAERGFLGFGEALAKEQVCNDPVTEPKRSPKPQKTASSCFTPAWLQFF